MESAGGRDIRVAGGADVIQQYLNQVVINELEVALAPVVFGGGRRLFENLREPMPCSIVRLLPTCAMCVSKVGLTQIQIRTAQGLVEATQAFLDGKIRVIEISRRILPSASRRIHLDRHRRSLVVSLLRMTLSS